MPCQQFPKGQPPANFAGGPFDTLDDCKKEIGTGNGCPCCSDPNISDDSGDCGAGKCCEGQKCIDAEVGVCHIYDGAGPYPGCGDWDGTSFSSTCIRNRTKCSCQESCIVSPPHCYEDPERGCTYDTPFGECMEKGCQYFSGDPTIVTKFYESTDECPCSNDLHCPRAFGSFGEYCCGGICQATPCS
jgi:hypothetical protein